MVDAPLATLEGLVGLLRLFDAPFRWAAAAVFFAPPDPCVVPTLELFGLRFEGFVTSSFSLARIVLLDLRATLAFDAGLRLPTRFRRLGEGTPLEVRFEVGFTLEAGPVFFVFELIVFFDFLRAAIVNLSTREHFRIHFNAAHEYYSKSVHEYRSSKRQSAYLPTEAWAPSLPTPSDSSLHD